MKKVVAFFLLGLFVALATSFTTQAAEGDLVDLYPYGQQACLEGTNACTQTKLADSFWDLEYAGHRYHFVRDSVRFASKFNDGDSSGTYSAGELGGALSWNAFGVMTINNTAEEAVLISANNRADITTNVHFIYTYFDETGKLQMFEDVINTYYIFNEGTDVTPANADWRLATEAEKTAYDAAAAESKPVTTRVAHIRMKRDASDSNGYKIEPLGYQSWKNIDAAPEALPEDQSVLVTGNPVDVTIPAGWTTVSFGINDRSASYPLTFNFVKSFPQYMIDAEMEAMTTVYTTQAPLFNNALGAADDDASTPGINIVVDYNAAFTLPANIIATYVDMYDVDGNIINTVRKIDYKVEIFQDAVLLETITYTYDSGTDAYTASGAATVVDSSVFGAAYVAKYSTVSPEDATSIKETEVDIVVGVMPPKFIGVENRYANEGEYVDVLEGITADDGYGNDITDTIEVTLPTGFNQYSPKPGTYEIDLTFTHNVYIEGINPSITLNGTSFTFSGATNVQEDNFATEIIVYTDVTNFKTSTFSWGSSGVIIEVGGDGKIIRTINRNTWDLQDENGLNTPANAQTMFPTWLANLTLEPNGFIIMVGRSTGTPYTAARALVYDQIVSYSLLSVDTIDEDIVKEASYVLTVDDLTAPQALVVNPNYKVEAGQYATVNQAILANIVAFDNFDAVEDLAVYVSNNGGLDLSIPSTYTVEVTVEDLAGNSTVKSFTVEVIAAKTTNEDVQDIIDEQTVSEEDVQGMLDDLETAINNNTLTPAQIQALIDAAKAAAKTETLESLPEDEVGTKLGVTIVIALGSSALSFAGAVLFLKKKI